MAALPKYQFIIKDQSGNLYEFERCARRAWDNYENDIGRCRFFIPKNDLKLSTVSVSDTEFSEIRVYRNGDLKWQGMISMVQDTLEGTYVYGETFMAMLSKYYARFAQGYSSSQIDTLLSAEYDNIAARTNNFLSAKITKGTIEAPYLTGTASPITITRTLYHENFLDLLKQLMYVARSEISASFDQYTVFNISFHETTPTFSFLRNVGTNKPDVIFELGSEIVDFSRPLDFRTIENEGRGYAVGAGPTALNSTESNSTSQTSFYRRETVPYYNNVTGQTDLDKRVANRIAENGNPRRDLFLKFAAGLTPFDGYAMGDNVIVRLDVGRPDLDEYRRVIGMEVTIDDSGVENTIPILQKARV